MAKASSVSQSTLEAALKDLLSAVDAGDEYPDAQWRVSQKHKVPADLLQTAYDEYCLAA